MATGRRGEYDDNDVKGLKTHFDFTGRDLMKHGYSVIRNGVQESGREKSHYERERGRIRQKDIKEREAVNGGYKSSSSRGDSGSSGGRSGGFRRWSRPSARAVDREPGELSSDSGSEGAIESDTAIKSVNIVPFDNDLRYPIDIKELKFSVSPHDKGKNSIRSAYDDGSGVAGTCKYLQSPGLYNVYSDFTNGEPIPLEGKSKAGGASSPLPVEASGTIDACGAASSIPTPSVFSSSPSHQQRCESYEQDIELLDEDDCVPTRRNISTSRWADVINSPLEKDEISDGEPIHKRRKTDLVSELSNPRPDYKSISPEIGEIPMEDSIGSVAKSSESDGGSNEEGYYRRSDSHEDDYMELDHNQRILGANISESDTESEDVIDSPCAGKCAVQPQRIVNMRQGCRSVDEFERLNRIDEGTYGVVYRAKDRRTEEIVALKKVKMEKEREGFPLTSLREINILLSFHHPSIVDVKEVVMGSNLDNIFMVMEYMEHDLKGLMETMKQPFSQSEVKCLMIQLLEGVKYLHDNWVLHRDLKTSNLLLNNRGELKICDFGLSRQYGSPLKPYTPLVVTLWYRAPELLLGAKKYSTAIDMWSLGCIMAELLSKEPLFSGKSELDQLDKIFRTLGTPSENIWPGFSKLPGVKVNFVKHQYNLLRKKFPRTSFTGSPVLSDLGFDLLNKLLTYDPDKRITAEDALNHKWFCEVPLPKSKDFMPTFPAQHAQDRRTRRVLRSPDPLEEQRRRELRQREIGTGGLFG